MTLRMRLIGRRSGLGSPSAAISRPQVLGWGSSSPEHYILSWFRHVIMAGHAIMVKVLVEEKTLVFICVFALVSAVDRVSFKFSL